MLLNVQLLHCIQYFVNLSSYKINVSLWQPFKCSSQLNTCIVVVVLIDKFALAPAAMDLLIINLKPLSKGYLIQSVRYKYIHVYRYFYPEK